MMIDPLQGWRTVNVTERRTGRDVAGRWILSIITRALMWLSS